MKMLAQRLLTLRKQDCLKQTEAAQALGLSISAYCRYEYGEREPTASTIIRMARYFEVSADYLLGLREEP